MSNEPVQSLTSISHKKKDSIWAIARKHIEWYIIAGEIIIAVIGALILFFPETIPYREAIGGGLFMLGITMVLEEVIKARDKEEHELEVMRERELHEKEVNEERARQVQLQQSLDKANADLEKTRKDLSIMHDDVHMVKEPIYQQYIHALCVGFGHIMDPDTKTQWLFHAKKLEIDDLYIPENSFQNSKIFESRLEKKFGIATSFAFQMGSTCCKLSYFGIESSNTSTMPIFRTILNVFNVKEEIISGVEKFYKIWFEKGGSPLGSKMYFLLIWIYLVDYTGGSTNVDFFQEKIQSAESLLIWGHRKIDDPDFCSALKACIDESPSHFEGTFVEM
ncbi:hypothetical protein [Methanoregula formicica]|uniref:Uncharacterized protein n=1 Tax=Methanoregula formicica (strain DSM 22288 / NBRC 105244 / SMSP) TaxID=593750 RepID=L0HDX5_METFS|nr:hypothetical protein [Methanoregula formicica]AGB02937.1 hypothetical protein Metfor_1919 [Methanoregula formicica SMSP]